MGLLTPGHWQDTHWQANHWADDHWPDYVFATAVCEVLNGSSAIDRSISGDSSLLRVVTGASIYTFGDCS